MSDYEYIFKQARKFHYSKWDDEELRKCVDMLPNLSREELMSLYRSKWLKDDKTFREAIFNTLFKDQIGKREARIKEMDTAALIVEFQDRKSGNVSLVRKEMQNRYKEGRDCDIIAEAFNASNEKDQQWVMKQEKLKEDTEKQ